MDISLYIPFKVDNSDNIAYQDLSNLEIQREKNNYI